MRGAVVAVVRPNGGPAASHAVARRCGRLGLCSQDAGRVKDWVRVRDAFFCAFGTEVQDRG